MFIKFRYRQVKVDFFDINYQHIDMFFFYSLPVEIYKCLLPVVRMKKIMNGSETILRVEYYHLYLDPIPIPVCRAK